MLRPLVLSPEPFLPQVLRSITEAGAYAYELALPNRIAAATRGFRCADHCDRAALSHTYNGRSASGSKLT